MVEAEEEEEVVQVEGLEVTGLEEEEEEETEVEVGAEAAGEEEAEGDAATKHK